ncbi:tRNA (adenine-N6)-methyltransferase [Citrobacter sp. wls830]|nr:tRNA (adenine-N6)-methyltransferase [Citrobacter sp. wls830]TKU40635.1 tRNA (adenine-N6)-methyltransferase [Citrobacter sp. wls714]TKU74214.1 tRNA (adenine-N6)-methyltransferase [Citrobacter sp. wls710]TKU77141.1 tRNA (adenine-N6)-methyltransferase [Citrobacter sp. wls706]TKV12429.1 tRNA (adenine-N6)-methyltransferase [Citrobacter sp. wls615]
MYGYSFSGIVFILCYRFFSQEGCSSCPSLHPYLDVMDLHLSSFLWHMIVVQ